MPLITSGRSPDPLSEQPESVFLSCVLANFFFNFSKAGPLTTIWMSGTSFNNKGVYTEHDLKFFFEKKHSPQAHRIYIP